MPSGSERGTGVSTMHRFLVLVALMVAACAPLKPDPGSRAACSTFQEQIEGVWLDAVGRERALFVLGSNSNGWGCFALLNPVPEWGLDTPVAINAKVKRMGLPSAYKLHKRTRSRPAIRRRRRSTRR